MAGPVELASRALDRDGLGWGQRTWGVPTSTISASSVSVRPGWRATGHHQQRPAQLALANVRNAWAKRRRWSLATVQTVESSRTAVDSPDAGRAEGGTTSAKLLLRARSTRTRTRRPAFHPATAITRFRNDLRTLPLMGGRQRHTDVLSLSHPVPWGAVVAWGALVMCGAKSLA